MAGYVDGLMDIQSMMQGLNILEADDTLQPFGTPAIQTLYPFTYQHLTYQAQPAINVVPDEEEDDRRGVVLVLKPIPSYKLLPRNTDKQLYTMSDEDMASYIHITVYRKRVNKYLKTIRGLLKTMKPIMVKYLAYIRIEAFMYVMRLKLESQIEEIFPGIAESKLRDAFILKMYRKNHAVKDDKYVIFDTICDVWRGGYNDKDLEGKVPEDLGNLLVCDVSTMECMDY